MLSDEELKNMQKVLELAAENSSFRDSLQTDSTNAINENSGELGFDSSRIPKEALDVLTSLTQDELAGLIAANKKAHEAKIMDIGRPF